MVALELVLDNTLRPLQSINLVLILGKSEWDGQEDVRKRQTYGEPINKYAQFASEMIPTYTHQDPALQM